MKAQLAYCVYCSYLAKPTMAPWPKVHPATEVVQTPNGPRALCEEHARDAIRKGEESEQ